MSLAWLARTDPLETFGPIERRLVVGMRHWAAAHRSGRWPVTILHDQIGCGRAAAHVQLLIEEIGHAWPEPFCLAPPCCRQTSHDETLIASMAVAAEASDRPRFDRLCAEMLGADARDRLFLSLGALTAALADAQARQAAQD